MVSLKYALANSINTITARLIDRVGPRPVIDLIEKMGVDTSEIPEAPSIALGTPDISVYDMWAPLAPSQMKAFMYSPSSSSV